MSEHSIWLLMTADDDDHDDNHAEDEPGRSERRLGGIGWVDVEAVAAALSGPESNPVGEWRTEELTISRPRLVIQLADGIVDPGARIREIARVPGPGRAVGDGPDALLVIAEFSDGWSVWSIPIALAERSARASVLRLDRDPAALPAGVRVHHFDSRPRPVRGACSRPLVALHGDGLGMHRLRYNDDEQRDEGYPAQGCTERVFIEGVEPLEVDGVHGLNSDADEAESHVLLTCGDELHLYRSSQPDQPWWRARELVCDDHATLAAGVSLFGVARDLLIFQLPDGLWAFLPMLALCPTESPWLAEIAAAANGLVLHADEPAPAQLTPLPLWVRVGQLADLSVGPDGSFAVTFQDSSWAELYVRSKGNLPAYACAVDGRYDGRGSGVCHVGLGDDRYLLLRTHHERVEFSWLSFDSTDWQVARILG